MADGIIARQEAGNEGRNGDRGIVARAAGMCRRVAHDGLFFACCLLLSMACYAEELRDPTRPPDSLSAVVVVPGGGGNVVHGLQSIIISKTRRVAIIDGKAIELGSNLGDEKLIEVNEGRVTLEGPDGRRVITLFPDVIMTGKQGIKIRPLPPMGEVRSGRQKSGPNAREERR